LAVRDRLQGIPWIKKIDIETGMPDLQNNPTAKLQIQVTDAHRAETELLRLVMGDATIVTEFARSAQNLEDVFVNLVAGDREHE
jgi:ABC-2 type transport system ATP-binding protein